MKVLNQLLILVIAGIRPLLGPAICKYPISCTEFAYQELQKKSFFPAMYSIIKRVVSCNPFYTKKI